MTRKNASVGAVRSTITIGDDAWIGVGAIILPDVTVGECAIVAAGAVVAGNVPARTVVAGNPARVLRLLEGGADEPVRARCRSLV